MTTAQLIVWFAFSLTYLGLALGKLPGVKMDRASIALLGAIILLATGVITFPQAIHSIHFETIGLLLGMMMIVAVLQRARFFARLAGLASQLLRSPRQLLMLVVVFAALLSAILVNDVVCLAMPPLLLQLCRQRDWDPKPHLIALALASNIGSACTPIGNPQNMLIAEWSHISFLQFVLKLSVPTLLSLLVTYMLLAWIYRRQLQMVSSSTSYDAITLRPSCHDRLLLKGVLVLLATIAAFLAGLPMATVALTAGTFLMIDRFSSRYVWNGVDWSLLIMFVGLFIVVGAFEQLIVQPGHWADWPTLQRDPVGLLSLASAILSNLVSNVPAVMLFKPVMLQMPAATQETGWLALAMSSTFAGNLTILGSIANLIVVEMARRQGVPISFWDYSKVGVPVTILSIVIGILWLKFGV
ncbi:MAG: anion transporter [Gemmatales bacterium]